MECKWTWQLVVVVIMLAVFFICMVVYMICFLKEQENAFLFKGVGYSLAAFLILVNIFNYCGVFEYDFDADLSWVLLFLSLAEAVTSFHEHNKGKKE